MSKRGKVWLAVSGLVITEDGRWLVVKKNYGGLQGKWSLPAGFVNGDETIDQAVKREILEETGIDTEVIGVIGIRSGVIRGEISDNMVLFRLKPKHENISLQEKELAEAVFLQPGDLAKDESTSVLVSHLLNNVPEETLQVNTTLNPGDHFRYTAYHLFL